MNKNIWNKRIPTLLGIFLIITTLFSTSYLANKGVILIGRANPTQTPGDIRITNISDTEFSVSYKTQVPVAGSINLGKDKNLGQIILDDRDKKTGSPSTHSLHYFTIKNLTSSSTYFFSIISGENSFLQDNAPFQVVTEPPLNSTSQKSMSGKIIDEDGSIPSEAIIYIKTQSDPDTLSSFIDTNGTYSINIALLRSKNSHYATISDNTVLQMLIMGSTKQSNISIKASNIHPVPIITLSKNYDFETSVSLPSATPSAFLSNFSFPSFSVGTKNVTPQILSPKKEESFTDPKPQFSGTASPGAIIKIVIHSDDTIQTQIKTDFNGKWSYRPTQVLSPGKHTISVTTQDQFGITKILQQSFVVFAEGSQFVEPSVSPTGPTPTLFLHPTNVPTLTPTPKPTLTLSSPTPSPFPLTPTPIIITATPPPAGRPTQTPSPTLPPFVNTTHLPPPGNSSVITILFEGLITISIALFLLFISRGILQI